MLCLPRLPLPAPHFLRCVLRAVQSGCPLSSLAGTPFYAVCVFRGLGPVALLVFPACPLCVCALALPRRPPPPPPRVGVARAPRAVPVLGAGRAVPRGPCPSACPASVPCSIWLAAGGRRPGLFSPLPGLRLCAPRQVGLRVWGVPTPGAGGGGCLPAVLPGGAAGGASGAGVFRVALALGGVAPIPTVLARLLSPGAGCEASLCASAGLLVHHGSCRSRRLGAWRRVLLRPPPPRAPRSFRGEGGPSPLPPGGWGAGAAVARGSLGRSGGTGGGVAPWVFTSRLREGGLWPPAKTPRHRRRIPPRCFVAGRGHWAAPGGGRHLPPAGQPGGGGRGGEGRPVCRPTRRSAPGA